VRNATSARSALLYRLIGNFDLGCAMNRYALAFLASLVLLSGAFAAVPWKEMNQGPVYGYDEAVSGAQTVAAN
jgi:hypothetical protein